LPKQQEGAKDHPFIVMEAYKGGLLKLGLLVLQAAANSSCYLFEFAFFK
jgi:hypothetical protein